MREGHHATCDWAGWFAWRWQNENPLCIPLAKSFLSSPSKALTNLKKCVYLNSMARRRSLLPTARRWWPTDRRCERNGPHCNMVDMVRYYHTTGELLLCMSSGSADFSTPLLSNLLHISANTKMACYEGELLRHPPIDIFEMPKGIQHQFRVLFRYTS